MAPKKVAQGAIIILDVGRNVSTPEEKGEPSFFEQARQCAIRLIERKIISQANNLVGIILLGSKKTKNAMAEQVQGAFKHIEMYSELVPPTWNMIRELSKTPSESKGDWVDAIIVAADHFNNLSGYNIENKKIILMTNFKIPTKSDHKDVQVILDGLTEQKFEVDVIGPDILDEMAKGDITLAQQFVESTNGATATFLYTMRYLLFHKKKGTVSRPWNVDLSIGPNIKIPVSTYIRTRDDAVVKRPQMAIKDPVSNTASATEAVIKKKFFVNNENQTPISEEAEPIKGYRYGQKVIPYSELNQSMLYQGGEKCLSVYGFTNASNITWQNLTGDGLHYVFGRKGDKKAQEAISVLVQCLLEMKLVGIVRRVYNNNNAPQMFALFPVIDTNDYVCLSMANICFKDDIKFMSFPSTKYKKFNYNEEQVKGFIDLIKAMDLTRAYDDTFDKAEAFPIGETVSPFAQHMLDCIAFRAMNPNEPLPTPREDILNLFKMPPRIEQRSKEPLEKLKSLFELKKVEKSVRKLKVRFLPEPSNVIQASQGDDVDIDIDIENTKLSTKPPIDIKRVGTLDPIKDYIALKENEKPQSELTQEMAAALESMVNANFDGKYCKVFDAMLFFRKECVESDPSQYNNWLKSFKEKCNFNKKHDFLSMVCDKNADFILKSENPSSDYETADSHNESQLYENDTAPDSIELSLQSEDDMFADF